MTREIPLTRGLVTIVDDGDYDRIMAAGPWHAVPDEHTVYAQRRVKRPDGVNTTQKMHTFLAGWPRTDHINGDGLDNRRTNLRPASQAENARNCRLRRDSTSGFKGVSSVRSGRWHAHIRVDGQRMHLGLFDIPEQAARIYFGEFARLNFPQEKAS